MDGTCLEFAGKATPRSTAMNEVEELSLIRRAQEGDRSAFDALIRLYDQNVLRLALQVVGSPEEARDLYQEAFLKVYRSIRHFRSEAKFSTWLYRVVKGLTLLEASQLVKLLEEKLGVSAAAATVAAAPAGGGAAAAPAAEEKDRV